MVMCAGLIVYAFADIMIITYFTYKLTNISLKTQLKELLPVLFLSFSMGGLVYGSICLFGNAWIQLSVGIIVGISYYLFISVLFHFKEMKILRSFGRC